MDIEAFREQLVVWGITPNVLVFIGVLSLITLFFSIRVVVKWYIGMHALQDEMRAMRKQLSEIQVMLSMTSMSPVALSEDVEEKAELKPASSKSDGFRLTNH